MTHTPTAYAFHARRVDAENRMNDVTFVTADRERRQFIGHYTGAHLQDGETFWATDYLGYVLTVIGVEPPLVGPTPAERDETAAMLRTVTFGNGERWVDGVMVVAGADRQAVAA